MRVMGVVERTRHELRRDARSLQAAQQYFLLAIREFEKHRVEKVNVWYAVAHWNVYNAFRDQKNIRKSVSFLKRAGDL